MADAPLHVALALVEQELAAEMPAHVRAFARAHAEGRTPPPAPLVARLASTLEIAEQALANEGLAERGLAIMRLVAPLAIESDPAVSAARAEPRSWPGLVALAEARDAASQARFECRAIDLLHRLHGSSAPPGEHDVAGPSIAGWADRDGAPLDTGAITDAWTAIAARLGVAGAVRVDRSRPDVQPRTFVVEPGREVIVIVPEIVASQAARFAVLHELGHAAAALVSPLGIPRAVDEAAASFIARLAEAPSWLPPRWTCPLGAAARTRRLAVAATLDDIERMLPALPHVPTASAAPPWALWHDPGAQAAYVAAETFAEQLRGELGPNPPRGQFARRLAAMGAKAA
ncbi:MAG TPA: hypothetical protein VGL61_18805 [Kofleriaceae bacterium]|jgi:hypothetical protein